jgi:6-phosphogluconate dehydrogenase (decarboxylating)
MHIAMIGLRKMGANMARRLTNGGRAVKKVD